MLCTAPTLRTVATGCRLQFNLLKPCTYYSNATAPLHDQETSRTFPRRANLAKCTVFFKPSALSIRSASSTASQSPSSTTTESTSTAFTNTERLDWNTFFNLRKSRRRYQLGFSIGTGLNGFVVGAQMLQRADMDALVSQIPLDPFITLGLITFSCGGLGWLTGPIIGTGIFNLKNRKYRAQMDEKEKEFFRRIKRYRVDPSASSMANPVPDYYGEKISSVAGYRQWLKDQRAFNKKRQTYV